MCGIIARLNFNKQQIDKNLFKKMRDTLYHRGPDDGGLYVDKSVALGHRRLSIIDLSDAGHQPMTNEDDTLVLVFNGEIYNYKELTADLISKGHVFKSNTDSEVILHQYEEDGVDCLKKLNGMFTFAWWDTKKNILFVARDRLGIKPLYYFLNNNEFIIASEIKAIIEDKSIERLPNYESISDYLYAGRVLDNKTIFENIYEVQPGHYGIANLDTSTYEEVKYWDINYNYNSSRTDEQLYDELDTLIDDAIKIHCRSDAPLGCHLSGGLDSSTVVAYASKYRKHLKTFSTKFSDDKFIDESGYAKLVAKHVGAEYIECNPTASDFAKLLPHLVWHMDMPMATNGGFSYYTVSKLARENATVSLTGHGGDELFAGYMAQFKTAYNDTSMFVLPVDPKAKKDISLFNRLVRLVKKGPFAVLNSFKKRLYKNKESFEDEWAKLHCGSLPADNEILDKSFVKRLKGYSPKTSYLKDFSNVEDVHLLDKCLYHDIKVYLPGLLHLEDRVSMSLSLESRVPLLDYRIVDFLATVPPEQKVKGLIPKFLLRKCASKLLPEKIWNRKDKFPFPVPASFWSTNEMKSLVKSIIRSPACLNRGIFDKKVLMKNDLSVTQLWSIINIELWFKIFIDQDEEWIEKIKI